MAILIINSERREWSAAADDSVLDIMVAAQTQKLWDPTWSIDSVTVDGAPVKPLSEAALKAIPGADAEIEISLSQVEERPVTATMAEARTYLERLETGLTDLAEAIRANPEKEHFHRLGEGLEGLSTIISLCGALRHRYDFEKTLDDAFQEYLEGLSDKLKELNEAQEAQDAGLIGDILEYEMAEAVQSLRGFLDRFEPYVE